MPTFLIDILRGISGFLDMLIFGALELVYRYFFEMVSIDFISSAIVAQFYSRFQLIIGVFVLFQLAMTIIKGIVNPDTFTDSKAGIGNIITRIFVALTILTLLVPINFGSPRNDFEQKVKDNGLLFGTLYSLQKRILENKTIEQLIFGNQGNNYSSDVKEAARVFTSTVIKCFYRINNKENQIIQSDNAKTCDNYDYSKYAGTISPTDLPEMATAKCGILSSTYAYSYFPLFSSAIALVILFFFVSFTIDVVVRAAKLGILRLIAPIPAITYMNPTGAKDNAFNSWTKLLISTYIDLFVRLATIYAVMFMADMVLHNSDFLGLGSADLFGKLIIVIALLKFAKEAPKFFKEALGLKGDGGDLFGGIASAIGVGGAIAAVAPSAISNAATNYRMSKEENAELHKGQTLRNAGRNILAAGGGLVGGALASGIDATKKNASWSTVTDSAAKRNAVRETHSTALGRFRSGIYSTFTGQGKSEQANKELEANKNAKKALADYKSVLEDKALEQKTVYGEYEGRIYNYRKLEHALNIALQSDSNEFVYDDGEHRYTLDKRQFDTNTMTEIKKKQTEAYSDLLLRAENMNNADFVTAHGTEYNALEVAKKAAKDASISAYQGYYGETKSQLGDISSKITKAETSMEEIMKRANDRQVKKK